MRNASDTVRQYLIFGIVTLFGVIATLFAWWQFRNDQFNQATLDVTRATQALPAYVNQPVLHGLSTEGAAQLFAIRQALQTGSDPKQALDRGQQWAGWHLSESFYVNLEYYEVAEEKDQFTLIYETTKNPRNTHATALLNSSDLSGHVINNVRDHGSFGCIAMLPVSASISLRCLLPVYNAPKTFMTVAERRASIRGLLVGVAHGAQDQRELIIAGLEGIEAGVYADEGDFNAQTLNEPLRAALLKGTFRQELIDFNGLPVRIMVLATDDLIQAYQSSQHWLILVLGMLGTGAVALLLTGFLNRSKQLNELIQLRTDDLSARSKALHN